MTNSPSRHGGSMSADAPDRQTPTDRHDGPAGDALRRHEREPAKPTRTSNPARKTTTDPPVRTSDTCDYRPVDRRGSNERPEQGHTAMGIIETPRQKQRTTRTNEEGTRDGTSRIVCQRPAGRRRSERHPHESTGPPNRSLASERPTRATSVRTCPTGRRPGDAREDDGRAGNGRGRANREDPWRLRQPHREDPAALMGRQGA